MAPRRPVVGPHRAAAARFHVEKRAAPNAARRGATLPQARAWQGVPARGQAAASQRRGRARRAVRPRADGPAPGSEPGPAGAPGSVLRRAGASADRPAPADPKSQPARPGQDLAPALRRFGSRARARAQQRAQSPRAARHAARPARSSTQQARSGQDRLAGQIQSPQANQGPQPQATPGDWPARPRPHHLRQHHLRQRHPASRRCLGQDLRTSPPRPGPTDRGQALPLARHPLRSA